MTPATPILDRILLTNDDGIDAPGLAVLERVAATLAKEVWVVAPFTDQSGTSHSISLHAPLRVSKHGTRRFGISGTPGDCVAMAVGHLMKDALPQLVLSGINRGANLGIETMFSGTVGAAMTALWLGVPSIALSQAFEDRSAVPWGTAERLAGEVITRLLAWDCGTRACLNVNFPACPPEQAGPVTLTRQGIGHLQGVEVLTHTDPRELDYHWLHLTRNAPADQDGTETAALAGNCITVTPLQFERTHLQAYDEIRAKLERPAP